MSAAPRWESVRTIDGRALEVLVSGPAGRTPLVYHNGTPTAPVPFDPLSDAAAAAGLTLVTYARPGYAGSDPQPGRTVAAAVADVSAILDHLGADDFLALGWSGGGPHALACAALLAPRCRGAATIGGVAPCPAEGLDWLAGMGPENVEEFTLALEGHGALEPWLEQAATHLAEIRAEDVADALGGLIPDVDRASLTGPFAEWAAAAFRRAVSTGVAGWRDDDLAFTRPWGFTLKQVSVPVTIWQGAQDLMVPFAHGQWLAQHIPGASARLFSEHGHLSLAVGHIAAIVADLAARQRG
ncbi:MAG: alpha/beta fold hydrolase [Mycobacteriales bacterium]